MKATGAQIKDFWFNGWPSNDWYYESEDYEIDDERGNFDLALEQEYDLSLFGYLVCKDEEACNRPRYWPFQDAFNEWLDSLDHDNLDYTIYTVRVPKDSENAFHVFINRIGGEYE